MHIDLEQRDAHQAGITVRHSRVCILGAGIAGLVLATELAAAGVEVTLLEAGGLELEERSQSLYEAEMPHTRHTGTIEGRFRTYGGSSTRWGGQLLSYPEDILHPVPGSPSHAWPLQGTDLQPYYERVLRLFHVPDLPFDAGLLPALGQPPVDLGEGIALRFSKWSPFARRNLAQTIGKQCLSNTKIHLYTHANVAALEGKDGQIRRVKVLDYIRREFYFSADQFVVCCGTVDSARLLLLSPDVPNPHGQTGLGFSDHISLHAAEVPQAARPTLQRLLGPFFADGVAYTPKLEATSELQREAGLLAVMAHFTIEEPEDSGIGAIRNLLTSLQRRQLKTALTQNLLPMLRGLPDVVRFAWLLKVRKRRLISSRATVRLNVDLEQDPNSTNRVLLSDATDALGLRKAVVQWHVNDIERETVRRFVPILRERLRAAGFPAFHWNEPITSAEAIPLADPYPPLGGLRMGTDPTQSVVDTQLRVHRTENLYVASCAVFPSGGSSNPTFTMMALTMRLAEHLRTTLQA